MLSKKIILGTVQLGLPYGINNNVGKPGKTEAFHILNQAKHHQIEILDSADAYGDSLSVIGSYLRAEGSPHFKIISKFTHDGSPLSEKVQKTLNELKTNSLYAYLYHRFQDYTSGNNKNELLDLKRNLTIEKIGVSVYTTQELEEVIQDKDITVIQVPFNPFDCSSEKMRLLAMAAKSGKEIHVRSVFLQGLFFKKPEDLTGNLSTLQEALELFHQVRKDFNLDVTQACLNFALHQNFIHKVLIGVETCDQLDKNMQAVLPNFSKKMSKTLSGIQIPDSSMLNPSNWKS